MRDLRHPRAGHAGWLLAPAALALGVLAARFDTFPGDRASARAVHALGDPFAAVATAANDWHGAAVALVLAAVAVAAVRRRRLDAVAVIALAGAGRVALNLGRLLVDRPRPVDDELAARLVAAGPSFPSGHVMTAMLACGLWFVLASGLVPSRAVWPVRAVAVLGVALAAFGRVWAGVHWPSDAVGAVVWMAAVLAWACAAAPAAGAARRALRRARRSPSRGRSPSG